MVLKGCILDSLSLAVESISLILKIYFRRVVYERIVLAMQMQCRLLSLVIIYQYQFPGIYCNEEWITIVEHSIGTRWKLFSQKSLEILHSLFIIMKKFFHHIFSRCLIFRCSRFCDPIHTFMLSHLSNWKVVTISRNLQ